MFTGISNNLILPFLNFSYYHIYPNYGVAIILMTIAIKILFYPLTKTQYTSMKNLQKVQPKLKEIQERLKSEPEKQREEMMKFYQENKVNPLGGCLPLLVQLPFFFAIFTTINSASFKALIAEPGIHSGLFPFWLANLAVPDHTFILPILIGAFTYLSQKLTPTDPQQQKLFMFVPFIIVFASLNMAAGVALYWAVSQIISTAQQYILVKQSTVKNGGLTT